MTTKNLYPSLGVAAVAILFASMATAQSTGTPATAPNKAKAAATTSPAPATAKNSGHATETLKATPKSSTASTATSHETVEYKDPEDMTTRYRPGNNKTSTLPPTAPTAPASDAEAKKHISNVKYEDRAVGFPACDGASKDAAKCVAAPPAAPSTTTKPATTDAQNAKHTGKIDSFTVKQ